MQRKIRNALPSRTAFTLVELLIVVTLLLLLTGMTVVAVDFAFMSERVSSAARQTQSMLEGARDRAIFAGEPRGVRFLLEDDDFSGRKVASMIYIAASTNWTQGTIQLERLDDNNDGTADGPDIRIVRGDSQTLWSTLKIRGYLGTFEDDNFNGELDYTDTNGNGTYDIGEPGEDENLNGRLDLEAPRIKIPGDRNGTWYTVLTNRLSPGNETLLLRSPYRDPGTSPEDEIVAFEGSGPSTYQLELPARILPDAELVQLPEGVVLDLDASKVPVSWRPPKGATYDTPYRTRLDIMFSPRGTVIDEPAAEGLIHFVVALRDDIELTTRSDFSDRRAPINQEALADSDPNDPENDRIFDRSRSLLLQTHTGLPADSSVSGDRALVTIYASTGKIGSPPLDLDDFDNDGWADDPFRFAVRGEVPNE